MKVHIKNLGILKQAEFTLGELTIICGGNNTGKTYATYALFGFLYAWREILSISVSDEKIRKLLAEGVVYINLPEHMAQARRILADGCLTYAKKLAGIFAAQPARFKDTTFNITLDDMDIHAAGSFNRKISVAKIELFAISKSADSMELVVTMLVERAKLKIPADAIRHIIENALKDILFSNIFPAPFIASAERTGAVIFRKELNFARNRLLEEMSQTGKNVDPMTLLFNGYQDHALPIERNVDFTRQAESFVANKHPDILMDFADIIGGGYTVTSDSEVYYQPKGKRLKLTMNESSSAVRSLLDIGFYLRHVAQPGDILMVDEPELSLHPENQRRAAKLFARLINLGIKVFITTHSDYIIKELNTLIMLNHDKPRLKHIAEKEGYQPGELLAADKIKVYIAEEASVKLSGNKRRTKCPTLTPADISPERGIEARSFDTTIETMNRIQEEIVWGEE